MVQLLQFQTVLDEEFARRVPPHDLQRMRQRHAAAALADMMVNECGFTEEIIDPAAANEDRPLGRLDLRRYYRCSVAVGSAADAEALACAKAAGIEEGWVAAMEFLRTVVSYDRPYLNIALAHLDRVPKEARRLVYEQQKAA